MTEPLEWVKGYRERSAGPLPRTYTATYSLGNLAGNGFLPRSDVNNMLHETGLYDFVWQMVWAEDYETPDAELPERIGNVDGYAVFIHGWTGSHLIWEDLPAMVARDNRRIVSLMVDHNGFGGTQFVDITPDLAQCSPVAAMHAVERWLEVLKLRRQPGDPRLKTINFIGHSMGGAALFFLREAAWRFGETTRLAIAPALLLHDDLHRAFFTALGLGIGLVGRIKGLQILENVVSPQVIETLAEGATEHVKEIHAHIYDDTPRSVTARTFTAMGLITEHPEPHKWELFQVMLGHKDRLVGLIPMIDLLQELLFDVNQVRVVMGTHYLFSVGEEMQRWHEQNRDMALDYILNLHNEALQRQRTGQPTGAL
jgi:pimeloyl-ACP methyl ester carboxylesterase